MAVPRIGALTIGQSPRDDVAPEFLGALGSEIELVQRGALDGLSRAEIADLSPGTGDYVLVTRLRDGSEVALAEESILARLGACLRQLEESGVELTVLFCTGEFPQIESRAPLIRPSLALGKLAQAIAPGGRLCAVVPSAAQIDTMRAKWSGWGFAAEVETLSPYSASGAEVREAAAGAARRACDLVVLDCIGYSRATRAIFREACGKPVLLPRTLAGRLVAELIDR